MGRTHVALLLAAATWCAVAAQSPPVTWTLQDSGVTVRLRGISAVSPEVAWASGAEGTVLRTVNGGRTWQTRPVAGAGPRDFRDVDAVSDRVAYVLSIGPGPASRIYKTIDGGATWTLQLANADPDVFLDAMAFADEAHGVAFSDSVRGAFVVFTTDDGGRHWTRVPPERLPPALPGEGAFAASGTNVAVEGSSRIWIGTTAARVLRSGDGGRTWSVTATPVATGEATGIFSIAFGDPRRGVVVGGNYQQEGETGQNVARSTDGGSTWAGPSGRGLSGFRSAAVWVSADSVLAVGPSGSDWSSDGGQTWTPAGGDGYDAVSLVRGGLVGWAAGSRGRLARVAVGGQAAKR